MYVFHAAFSLVYDGSHYLIDNKMVSSSGRYKPSRGHSIGHCPAVRAREQAVNTEYVWHSRHLNATYMDTAPSVIGPVQRCLLEFGRVQKVVVGRFAEESPFVKTFHGQCASRIASHSWMEMGSRSVDEARSVIFSRLRRDFEFWPLGMWPGSCLTAWGLWLPVGRWAVWRTPSARASYARWQRQYRTRSGFDFWNASPAAKAHCIGSDW